MMTSSTDGFQKRLQHVTCLASPMFKILLSRSVLSHTHMAVTHPPSHTLCLSHSATLYWNSTGLCKPIWKVRCKCVQMLDVCIRLGKRQIYLRSYTNIALTEERWSCDIFKHDLHLLVFLVRCTCSI